MKVKYIPRPRLYTEHYCQQGTGSDYFSGLTQQKGYGLGGIITGFVKSATPLLKKAGKQILKRSMPLAKKLGRQALMSGMKGITDVITKKRTAKEAFREGGQTVRNKIAEIIEDEIHGNHDGGAGKPKKARLVSGKRRPRPRRQIARPRRTRSVIDDILS